MFEKKKIVYRDGDTTLCGLMVSQQGSNTSKPAILIAHDWSGCNSFAEKKAEQMAELGYIGFAIDMYGDGKIGSTKEEKSALMQPLMQDRALLQSRINAALMTLTSQPTVDATRIGAIGFCFGGLCVLDLARSGADIKGVVSFHGLFIPPANPLNKPIKANVLALHGFDDPMVTHDQIIAFGNEMTAAKANWELDIYGNTMHAFANPEANDPGFGTLYSASADKKSFRAMKHFFEDLFR